MLTLYGMAKSRMSLLVLDPTTLEPPVFLQIPARLNTALLAYGMP